MIFTTYGSGNNNSKWLLDISCAWLKVEFETQSLDWTGGDMCYISACHGNK